MAARVVVMGVCGSGKSTLGLRLAEALGAAFVEGDELHPPRNVELMAAGIALTDLDREGWLRTLAGKLRDSRDADRALVVSCSALKRSYRDLLRAGANDVRFIYLRGDAELLAVRLATRCGHYMPASLLPSQLATLEPPAPDEQALVFDIRCPVADIARDALQQLGTPAP